MNSHRDSGEPGIWLGVVAILFGLLLLAGHANEFLKQLVLVPGSSAELGLPADCRPDELEEEGLSLQECQLLVSGVQGILLSSPPWFRQVQLGLSLSGLLLAAASVVIAVGLINQSSLAWRWAIPAFACLLLLDLGAFVAALNTGPLLRAQYLWPLLLWISIHITLLTAVLGMRARTKSVVTI
jgi:hypothetical protein